MIKDQPLMIYKYVIEEIKMDILYILAPPLTYNISKEINNKICTGVKYTRIITETEKSSGMINKNVAFVASNSANDLELFNYVKNGYVLLTRDNGEMFIARKLGKWKTFPQEPPMDRRWWTWVLEYLYDKVFPLFHVKFSNMC